MVFLHKRPTDQLQRCITSPPGPYTYKYRTLSKVSLASWADVHWKLGFLEDARHTPIVIRYHKVYIFEHVWTQGMILGRFQGNWHVLVPIGGATFDTARSPERGKKLSEKLKMFPKFTGPYFVKNKFLHTYCKHQVHIFSVFDEKIGGHRCFFSATGNKMGAHRIFFQYWPAWQIYAWSKVRREKKCPHT
jgi:hypothetical protein